MNFKVSAEALCSPWQQSGARYNVATTPKEPPSESFMELSCVGEAPQIPPKTHTHTVSVRWLEGGEAEDLFLCSSIDTDLLS